MKKIGILLVMMALAGAATAQAPEATFEKKGLKFENIIEGTELKIVFHFTNTGNAPLKINSVSPTCGCTVATYPKEEIQPGQRDSINVVFDSKNRVGYNAKGVNLTTNAGVVNLIFEAVVVAKEGEEQMEKVPANTGHEGHNH